MPVLKNAKHERFAQGLAQGKTATDAHEAAGFKRDDGNASKLAARPEVQARVQEITGAAAAKVGVGIEQVVAELVKIGFSNMLDYMTVGPDGQPRLDFSALSRDQAACIQELVVESRPDNASGEGEEEGERGEILKVRFKLADKRAALVDLGKHLGMFKQQLEHDMSDPLKELFKAISGTAFRPKTNG